jgi:hypothetical protein
MIAEENPELWDRILGAELGLPDAGGEEETMQANQTH